jgi:hypothetical protein
MITAVLLGPGVVVVLSLILAVTTRIEHRLTGTAADEEKSAGHAR